jgi:hypothetical protein
MRRRQPIWHPSLFYPASVQPNSHSMPFPMPLASLPESIIVYGVAMPA